MKTRLVCSTLNIPFESFRIFDCVDDTSFTTTAPGWDAIQRLGYSEDTQRAFYSRYITDYVLKIQAVTLPNGLFDSIYVAHLSDGLPNMSE